MVHNNTRMTPPPEWKHHAPPLALNAVYSLHLQKALLPFSFIDDANQNQLDAISTS